MEKLDKDDRVKLKRVMKYLKGIRELKLTLSFYDVSVVKWGVDSLYAVQEDYQGNTGAIISLGKGEVSRFCTKKR